MCTVTFWPQHHGYRLAMNRDEKWTRAPGLPPTRQQFGARTGICPREPNGGTWIGLNDCGITFALVNWYSRPQPTIAQPISRGRIVLQMLPATTVREARTIISPAHLGHILPFRLAGIFPEESAVREWQWDGRDCHEVSHPWKPQQWISSGWDEANAQRIRGQFFATKAHQSTAGSRGWLRRLHRSHQPERGPFSTCVHRTDAGTVSYTEIEWTKHRGAMTSITGCPCQALPQTTTRVSLEA